MRKGWPISSTWHGHFYNERKISTLKVAAKGIETNLLTPVTPLSLYSKAGLVADSLPQCCFVWGKVLTLECALQIKFQAKSTLHSKTRKLNWILNFDVFVVEVI